MSNVVSDDINLKNEGYTMLYVVNNDFYFEIDIVHFQESIRSVLL